MMPSNPPAADEEDTGVFNNLYSVMPPAEEDFRPNNECDDEMNIEDDDENEGGDSGTRLVGSGGLPNMNFMQSGGSKKCPSQH